MKLITRNLPAEQQDIIIEIQPEGAEIARSLLSHLESRIHAGVRFLDGQTIEFGWMLLMLRQADGGLEVLEPDFDHMPILWCRGINNAVRHMQLQRAVCDLFGCEPDFATIMQAGVISPGFLKSTHYVMSRNEPENSDSGWLLAENGYTGSEGEFVSLYQLSLGQSGIIPFLALPPSSRVSIGPGFRHVMLGSTVKTSEDTGILSHLASSPILV